MFGHTNPCSSCIDMCTRGAGVFSINYIHYHCCVKPHGPLWGRGSCVRAMLCGGGGGALSDGASYWMAQEKPAVAKDGGQVAVIWSVLAHL
eukprot:365942-Chlamydomonas_euryale.AAC.36